MLNKLFVTADTENLSEHKPNVRLQTTSRVLQGTDDLYATCSVIWGKIGKKKFCSLIEKDTNENKGKSPFSETELKEFTEHPHLVFWCHDFCETNMFIWLIRNAKWTRKETELWFSRISRGRQEKENQLWRLFQVKQRSTKALKTIDVLQVHAHWPPGNFSWLIEFYQTESIAGPLVTSEWWNLHSATAWQQWFQRRWWLNCRYCWHLLQHQGCLQQHQNCLLQQHLDCLQKHRGDLWLWQHQDCWTQHRDCLQHHLGDLWLWQHLDCWTQHRGCLLQHQDCWTQHQDCLQQHQDCWILAQGWWKRK